MITFKFNENSGFSDVVIDDQEFSPSEIPYHSIQGYNYYYVYIDEKRYKKEKCFIYYIREFMTHYYRNKKLNRILT
jgi:hypothetical protein